MIRVHVYVNGVGHSIGTGGYRPDVHRAYPQASDRAGFAVTVSAATGIYPVCVYAINIGVGSNVLMGGGCRTVWWPTRTRSVTWTVRTARGPVWSGSPAWAYDPSAPTQPLSIDVYVNGTGYARRPGSRVRTSSASTRRPRITRDSRAPCRRRWAVTPFVSTPLTSPKGTNQKLGCPIVVCPAPAAVVVAGDEVVGDRVLVDRSTVCSWWNTDALRARHRPRVGYCLKQVDEGRARWVTSAPFRRRQHRLGVVDRRLSLRESMFRIKGIRRPRPER